MPDASIPEELQLVGSFVNTFEKMLDPGKPDEESLDGPDALAAWMRDHRLPVGAALDGADLARAVAFREALRTLLRANNGSDLDPSALAVLRDAAADGL